MADSSPTGDQPRASGKSISDARSPSIQYRTMSSKPVRRKTGRDNMRS